MKNIVVIGGAGFIGSTIIRHLYNRNKNVKIIVLEPSFANVSRLDGLDVIIIRTELSNFDLIESIIRSNKVDTVIHLVSTLIPGSGYEDYKREIQNVAFPTMRLTQLCSELSIKFVYFSSGGTVYGNRTNPVPFIESDKREPISYYGLTKLMLENNILFEHRTQGLKYLIIRPSNPYGHGQALNGRQGFIAVAIGKILRGEDIEIWGDGSSIRDYIYIEDLGSIVSELLNKEISNTIVNLGSGVGTSNNQIVDILHEVCKEDFKVVYKPSRSIDVSAMVLSTDYLFSLVQYETTDIKDGIRQFYNEITELKKY